MAEVDILVNDRAYKVTCDDGQEPRLHRLVAHIDGHVRSLVAELGQIGDARLMLLAALTVADELHEAKTRLLEAERGAEGLDAGTIGGATRVIEAATGRIEGLAQRLESAQ